MAYWKIPQVDLKRTCCAKKIQGNQIKKIQQEMCQLVSRWSCEEGRCSISCTWVLSFLRFKSMKSMLLVFKELWTFWYLAKDDLVTVLSTSLLQYCNCPPESYCHGFSIYIALDCIVIGAWLHCIQFHSICSIYFYIVLSYLLIAPRRMGALQSNGHGFHEKKSTVLWRITFQK